MQFPFCVILSSKPRHKSVPEVQNQLTNHFGELVLIATMGDMRGIVWRVARRRSSHQIRADYTSDDGKKQDKVSIEDPMSSSSVDGADGTVFGTSGR